MEPLIKANTKFSIDLLKALCKVNTGNVLFSPLSISSALGLVLLGAGKGSQTAEQMYTTLRFYHEHIIYHDLYEELYKGGNNRSLKLVNRMFGEKTLNFYGDYLDMCDEWCYASLRNIDFKTNPVVARDLINYWVQDKTGNQIKNFLDKGDVTKDTGLVLVSAVHFMDKWVQPFKIDKFQTLNWPLMMSQTNTFPLGNIPHRQRSITAVARILEIPYANKDLSMLIILPNQRDGLQKVVDLITYENLLEWTEPDNMIPTEVDARIPIFKLQESYDLKNVLKTLGITDLFDEKCDLSGMSPGPLKLPKVVHKCSVEVNEEGTDADGGSSADAVDHSLSRSNKSVEMFMADHPFLFFIRHNPTTSIIFWSRFSKKPLEK